MKSIEGFNMSPSNLVPKISMIVIGLILSATMFWMACKNQAEHRAAEEKEVVIVVLYTEECFVGHDYHLGSEYLLLKKVWGETDLALSNSTPHAFLKTDKPWQWAAVQLGADPIECQGDITEEEEEEAK